MAVLKARPLSCSLYCRSLGPDPPAAWSVDPPQPPTRQAPAAGQGTRQVATDGVAHQFAPAHTLSEQVEETGVLHQTRTVLLGAPRSRSRSPRAAARSSSSSPARPANRRSSRSRRPSSRICCWRPATPRPSPVRCPPRIRGRLGVTRWQAAGPTRRGRAAESSSPPRRQLRLRPPGRQIQVLEQMPDPGRSQVTGVGTMLLDPVQPTPQLGGAPGWPLGLHRRQPQPHPDSVQRLQCQTARPPGQRPNTLRA
jgi:hypothetical protein